MKNQKILIFGFFPYPGNSGSTARTHNLGQGLAFHGKEVIYLPILPSHVKIPENSVENKKINYLRLNSISTKGGKRKGFFSKPIRWLRIYWAAIKAHKTIFWMLLTLQVDSLIVYGSNFSLLFPSIIACRLFRVPAILDIVELRIHKSRWEQPKFPLNIDLLVGENILPRIASGTVIIARKLSEKSAINKKNPLLIPALESWDGPMREPQERLPRGKLINLCYLGSLLPRDDPKTLFTIVSLLIANDYRLKLYVFGNYKNNKFGREWQQYCLQDKDLRDSVRFMGFIPRELLESNEVFFDTDAFILPRRNVETEQYSFPTRLVEFLRYGKPVIVSAVGDIPYYLTPDEAVLISPNDSEDAVNSIISALNDNERWTKFGHNGQLKGKEVFDRNKYGKLLIDYIQEIRRAV
jgi:glycosyltransferase involved in cell wall biosynthesis